MHWPPAACTGPALCNSTAFVFGYGNFASGQWQAVCSGAGEENCWVIVNKSDVYYCVQQIDCPNGGADDWAVVQLDRNVVGRTPLPIRRDNLPPSDPDLTIVGHPIRIPMKIEEDVQLLFSGSGYYQVDANVISGNSGSMVVDDENGEVIGVVNGPGDAIGVGCEPAEPDDCYRENFAALNLVYVTAAYLAKDYIPELP